MVEEILALLHHPLYRFNPLKSELTACLFTEFLLTCCEMQLKE